MLEHTIKVISSPDSRNIIFTMLSLLVSTHDDNGHYKEANVGQDDQNERNDE